MKAFDSSATPHGICGSRHPRIGTLCHLEAEHSARMHDDGMSKWLVLNVDQCPAVFERPDLSVQCTKVPGHTGPHTHSFVAPRIQRCAACGGTGHVPDGTKAEGWSSCAECEGWGTTLYRVKHVPAQVHYGHGPGEAVRAAEQRTSRAVDVPRLLKVVAELGNMASFSAAQMGPALEDIQALAEEREAALQECGRLREERAANEEARERALHVLERIVYWLALGDEGPEAELPLSMELMQDKEVAKLFEEVREAARALGGLRITHQEVAEGEEPPCEESECKEPVCTSARAAQKGGAQ